MKKIPAGYSTARAYVARLQMTQKLNEATIVGWPKYEQYLALLYGLLNNFDLPGVNVDSNLASIETLFVDVAKKGMPQTDIDKVKSLLYSGTGGLKGRGTLIALLALCGAAFAVYRA